ncbi:MAG: alanine:cation symporter family protein [Woeseiaceae bacterium]
MLEIVNEINGWVWSAPLVYLCLGAGLLFSILTRFVQVRMFREMLHLLFSSKSSKEGISSFQALAVSLSGRVGTGNIAGVAAAIGFGGPGAIFWMWVVAFLGSSTAYIESALGQIYKETDEGEYRGGPAFYFEKARPSLRPAFCCRESSRTP